MMPKNSFDNKFIRNTCSISELLALVAGNGVIWGACLSGNVFFSYLMIELFIYTFAWHILTSHKSPQFALCCYFGLLTLLLPAVYFVTITSLEFIRMLIGPEWVIWSLPVLVHFVVPTVFFIHRIFSTVPITRSRFVLCSAFQVGVLSPVWVMCFFWLSAFFITAR